MDKRALVVAFHFPPDTAIGALRLQGLARYLPQFGWQPVFLTPELPGDPDSRFEVVQTPYPGDASAILKQRLRLQPDRGFQEQIGVPLWVRGSKNSVTKKFRSVARSALTYPDEQRHWYATAVRAGLDLLGTKPFQALLSSSPPATTHRIACALQAESGLPWVADFRDLWTLGSTYEYPSVRKLFERRLELRTLASAGALVSTSAPWAQQLGDLHKGRPTFPILNGYDPGLSNNGATVTPKFTITHTGYLYRGQRDPEVLLEALSELIDEGAIDRTDVSVRFYGPEEYWLRQEIEEYGLEDIAVQHGSVTFDVSIAKQHESQILLLLSWGQPGDRGWYTGKVFEYLAARRPILCVGGVRGAVSELLEETGAGAHTSELTAVKVVLTDYYNEYKATGSVRYRGVEEEVLKYSHVEMAKRFADVLDQVV
jgi:hypothetical protein